jgi:hypothetical protein
MVVLLRRVSRGGFISKYNVITTVAGSPDHHSLSTIAARKWLFSDW